MKNPILQVGLIRPFLGFGSFHSDVLLFCGQGFRVTPHCKSVALQAYSRRWCRCHGRKTSQAGRGGNAMAEIVDRRSRHSAVAIAWTRRAFGGDFGAWSSCPGTRLKRTPVFRFGKPWERDRISQAEADSSGEGPNLASFSMAVDWKRFLKGASPPASSMPCRRVGSR